MAKVISITGQQRLAQLAKSQLGTTLSRADSNSTTDATSTVTGSGAHLNLIARSGATSSNHLTLLQRAERRRQMQWERQQYNLESIMTLAMEYCTSQTSTEEIDPDWFQQFCELVLEISNKDMQRLWAKILAGEIANPGKFSLKTLHTLKRISFKEAIALQQAASLSCRSRQDLTPRIYIGFNYKPSIWRMLLGKKNTLLNLNQFGLTYPQILSLMDIGLLHHSEIESGTLNRSQSIQWQYQHLTIEGKLQGNEVVLLYYKYTACGAELLPLLSIQSNENYIQALKVLMADIIDFT